MAANTMAASGTVKKTAKRTMLESLNRSHAEPRNVKATMPNPRYFRFCADILNAAPVDSFVLIVEIAARVNFHN